MYKKYLFTYLEDDYPKYYNIFVYQNKASNVPGACP